MIRHSSAAHFPLIWIFDRHGGDFSGRKVVRLAPGRFGEIWGDLGRFGEIGGILPASSGAVGSRTELMVREPSHWFANQFEPARRRTNRHGP